MRHTFDTLARSNIRNHDVTAGIGFDTFWIARRRSILHGGLKTEGLAVLFEACGFRMEDCCAGGQGNLGEGELQLKLGAEASKPKPAGKEAQARKLRLASTS